MDDLDYIMTRSLLNFLGLSDRELEVAGLDRQALKAQADQVLTQAKKEGDPK